MTEPSARPVPSRIAFAVVATMAMMIGTLLPFAVPALAPFILPELGFSRAQLGSLVTAFFLVSALVSPAIGSSVDRFGGWQMMLSLFGVGAISFVGVALAPSYAWMFAIMAFAGIANALTNPTTNQVIGEYVAPGSRGTLVGIKQSGVQVGATLSGLALPSAALILGWRMSVLSLLSLAIGGFLVGWFARPEPRPARTRTVLGSSDGSGAPRVRWLVTYAFLMGSGVIATNTYIVLFAHEQLEVSATWAGRALGALGVSAVIARIAWARLAERRADPVAVLITLAIIATGASALLFVAPTFGGTLLLWPAVIALGASASAWNSVGMLAIIDQSDGGSTGRASGKVLTGFFAGNVVSPIAFGWLVDTLGTYQPAWAITSLLFAAGLAVAMSERRHLRRAHGTTRA